MNFSDINTQFYLANREQPEEPDDVSYQISANENGGISLVFLLGVSGLAVLSVLMMFIVG